MPGLIVRYRPYDADREDGARWMDGRRAVYLNEAEKAGGNTERMTGRSLDVFSCLPETVDPRPEGALR